MAATPLPVGADIEKDTIPPVSVPTPDTTTGYVSLLPLGQVVKSSPFILSEKSNKNKSDESKSLLGQHEDNEGTKDAKMEENTVHTPAAQTITPIRV